MFAAKSRESRRDKPGALSGAAQPTLPRLLRTVLTFIFDQCPNFRRSSKPLPAKKKAGEPPALSTETCV